MKRVFLLLVPVILVLLVGCSKETPELSIGNVSLPGYKISDASLLTIKGEGFLDGDKVLFRIRSVGRTYAAVRELKPDYVIIEIPEGFSGEYEVWVDRAGEFFPLGKVTIGRGPKINDIVIPSLDDVNGAIRIEGSGFVEGDSIVLASAANMDEIHKVMAYVDKTAVSFVFPAAISGEYGVSVMRDGIMREIGRVYLPKTPPVSTSLPMDEVMLFSNVQLMIQGVASSDGIILTPEGSSEYYAAYDVAINGPDVGFKIPSPVQYYPKMEVSVVRSGARTVLGSIHIKAPAVGDAAFGGVVFYVQPGTNHGFAYDTRGFGGIKYFFGPSVVIAPLPNREIGTGRANSRSMIEKSAEYRKTALLTDKFQTMYGIAEICDTVRIHKNGVVYKEWYVPSFDELVELYKFVHPTINAGFAGGAYWSSSELAFNTAEPLNIFAYPDVAVASAGEQWKEWAYGDLVAIRNF